ncbi:MAG: DUF3826 domain-containing protein [Fermentimonas sp.]|nr:DUF3826 domain-containing protein [Fermentimonas sp.]MDD4008675.1 DUF3826 domain-containing protein [Fermentimonas sp.]MDD4697088.1 DUF3826 domain-containing protein [Fermentimonas sp.]
MKKKAGIWLLLFIASVAICNSQQVYENRFERPLSDVLEDISERFDVRLSYDIDTAGLILPYADFRIKPYSLEESLTNVLVPFDFKVVKQNDKLYKVKTYEYARRTPEDGEKMLSYLLSLYSDKESWEQRKVCLQREVRENLGIDSLLSKRVQSKPILSKVRKFDGYSVQNFAIETLPGLFVAGSIYTPLSKGKHALIISPNGHFGDGRYREEQQLRMGSLARAGAITVSYDLFGWGESALQVGNASHRSSAAHIIQAMNGITILDYMLTRNDVDKDRVGATGGSGGGSQTILLSVLDDRYKAVAPVVMLASHFDGGCPCESGMPVTLSCGGTNNAELIAMFAPKPLLVVSDGGDWTASVPTLEFPYLQRIYEMYNARESVQNVHLPKEGHDYGINKRRAVYDFFGELFLLDLKKIDESKVTIESENDLKIFGANGELYPDHAIKSFGELTKYFNKDRYRDLLSDLSIENKAAGWVASLELEDKNDISFLNTLIYNHLRAVRDWHNTHSYTMVPEGINPLTGQALSQLDRQMIVNSTIPDEVHHKLMSGLRRVLTEPQVEAVLDKYTVGKVDFTMQGYKAIVPDLTIEEEATILSHLKQAREQAIDYKNMNQISAIFEIYKTKCEQYLINNGRNWRQLYKDFVNKVNEEKKKTNNNK